MNSNSWKGWFYFYKMVDMQISSEKDLIQHFFVKAPIFHYPCNYRCIIDFISIKVGFLGLKHKMAQPIFVIDQSPKLYLSPTYSHSPIGCSPLARKHARVPVLFEQLQWLWEHLVWPLLACRTFQGGKKDARAVSRGLKTFFGENWAQFMLLVYTTITPTKHKGSTT